jgi:predicted NBD/HSP70 family sugar kinase
MDKSLKFKETANSKVQFKINSSIIFNYLRKKESISRSEISKKLNISPPAVSRAISKLIDGGYIIENEKIVTKIGKRPMLFKVNPDFGYVLGINLGKINLSAAVTDFCGETVLNFSGFKITNSENIADQLINEIKQIFINMELTKNININRIKAISLGVPATIDHNSGEIKCTPLFEKWEKINFKKTLEKEFNIPVLVENDVNLSALGEKRFGVAKNYNYFAFIEISNGIGAGIIINNTLLRGAWGSAGEIGYSIVDPGNIDFKSIKNNFIENNISIKAIKNKVKEALKTKRISELKKYYDADLNTVDISNIFHLAANGDGLSKEIMQETVDYLSIVLINVILLLNPEIIVLGGELCSLLGAEDIFLSAVKERISKMVPFSLPLIKISSLQKGAGAVGAAYFAIENLLSTQFPYEV